METIHRHPGGTEAMQTILDHIIAGTRIDRPVRGETYAPIQSYFASMAQHNSIFTIIRTAKEFDPSVVAMPAQPIAVLSLGPASSVLSRKVSMRCMVPSSDTARQATAEECRNHVKVCINGCLGNINGLAKFIAASPQPQIPTDDPRHPLWRPVGINSARDPFAPINSSSSGSAAEVARLEAMALHCRQVVCLEYLLVEIEKYAFSLFAVGRTSDKGASFSNDGTDVFADNDGFLKDFDFIRRLYLEYCWEHVEVAELVNMGTVEGYELSRDCNSMLDSLSSMGI